VISVHSLKGQYNLLGLWYLGMLHSGRADKFFYAGEHTLKSALEWSDKTSYIGGAFLGDDLIGLGFAQDLLHFDTDDGVIIKATIGFGFLPGPNIFQCVKAGRQIVTDCFSTTPIDHMFGTTPDKNREALAYIKRIGFQLYGPIPNYCMYNGEYTGAYKSHISRKEWLLKNNNS